MQICKFILNIFPFKSLSLIAKCIITDPAEAESPPVTPPIRVSSTSSYTPSYPSPPLTPQDVNPFSYGVSRMRNSSGSLTDTKDLGIAKEKIRQTKSDAQHVSLRRLDHGCSWFVTIFILWKCVCVYVWMTNLMTTFVLVLHRKWTLHWGIFAKKVFEL